MLLHFLDFQSRWIKGIVLLLPDTYEPSLHNSNIKITETNPLALGSKTPIKSNINSSKSVSILDLIRSFQDMVLLLYGK